MIRALEQFKIWTFVLEFKIWVFKIWIYSKFESTQNLNLLKIWIFSTMENKWCEMMWIFFVLLAYYQPISSLLKPICYSWGSWQFHYKNSFEYHTVCEKPTECTSCIWNPGTKLRCWFNLIFQIKSLRNSWNVERNWHFWLDKNMMT